VLGAVVVGGVVLVVVFGALATTAFFVAVGCGVFGFKVAGTLDAVAVEFSVGEVAAMLG